MMAVQAELKAGAAAAWEAGGVRHNSKAAFSAMQGETLEQQFGEQEVCFRTLDLYTSAVLESSLNPVVQPRAEFRTAMDEMAKVGSVQSSVGPANTLQHTITPGRCCAWAYISLPFLGCLPEDVLMPPAGLCLTAH